MEYIKDPSYRFFFAQTELRYIIFVHYFCGNAIKKLKWHIQNIDSIATMVLHINYTLLFPEMEKIMMTEAVKITQKGQITIPKEIRDRLKTNTIYFEVVNDDVIVRAVKDAAGSLSEYAKNVSPLTTIQQMKETAWGEAVHEKASQKSS